MLTCEVAETGSLSCDKGPSLAWKRIVSVEEVGRTRKDLDRYSSQGPQPTEPRGPSSTFQ